MAQERGQCGKPSWYSLGVGIDHRFSKSKWAKWMHSFRSKLSSFERKRLCVCIAAYAIIQCLAVSVMASLRPNTFSVAQCCTTYDVCGWDSLFLFFFFRDAVLKDYHKMQIQFQFQFYCLHAPNAQYTLLWASEVRFCYLNQRKCIST